MMQKFISKAERGEVQKCLSLFKQPDRAMNYKILHVDDEVENFSLLKDIFRFDENIEIHTASSLSHTLDHSRNNEYALIVLDYQMGDITGVQIAKRILEKNPRQQFLILSGDLSRESIKDSVGVPQIHEWIDRSEDPSLIKQYIWSFLKKFDETERGASICSEKGEIRQLIRNTLGLVGESEALSKVATEVVKFAQFDDPVLIIGESGTGKEFVAKAIHAVSNRRGNFIARSCGSLGQNEMAESELFGHEKGAFTGAISSKVGKFELANNGTLFLDEIHDLSESNQAKLLRALQEGQVERLGANRVTNVNVRLVSATQSSEKLENRLRDDLVARIKGLTIEIPPLRKRPEDIEPYVLELCEEWTIKNKKPPIKFLKSTIKHLTEYDWPGNYRELRACVRKGLIDAYHSKSERVEPRHLPSVVFDKSGRSIRLRHLNLEERWTGIERERRALEKEFFVELESKFGSGVNAAKKLDWSKSTYFARRKAAGLRERENSMEKV